MILGRIAGRVVQTIQHPSTEKRSLLLVDRLDPNGEPSGGYLLAIDNGMVATPMEGIETTEPTFGLPAKWIMDDQRADAEIKGYTVIDPASVLVTHLAETIKNSSHEILSRDDVQELLDNLKERSPTVIDELVPNVVTSLGRDG